MTERLHPRAVAEDVRVVVSARESSPRSRDPTDEKMFGTTRVPPGRKPSATTATSVDDEREYDDRRFAAREVSRTDRSKTVCGYFEPDQFIPVHAPDSDVTIVVRSGEGIVRDGDEEHAVSPGSVVTVPAGRDRGVRADGTRLEAVLVTAPPPTDEEHAPVREGIRTDTFDPGA